MALYNNGKRISGIRDFPAYTWAEYQALPVAQRPKVWKCTDRDYTEIQATTDLLGTATGSGAWQNVTITNMSDYRELMVCMLTSYGGVVNPIRVPTKFFKDTLNTDTVYLSLRVFFNASTFVDYAVRYVSDTSVRFYGTTNSNVRIGIYGVK